MWFKVSHLGRGNNWRAPEQRREGNQKLGKKYKRKTGKGGKAKKRNKAKIGGGVSHSCFEKVAFW